MGTTFHFRVFFSSKLFPIPPSQKMTPLHLHTIIHGNKTLSSFGSLSWRCIWYVPLKGSACVCKALWAQLWCWGKVLRQYNDDEKEKRNNSSKIHVKTKVSCVKFGVGEREHLNLGMYIIVASLGVIWSCTTACFLFSLDVLAFRGITRAAAPSTRMWWRDTWHRSGRCFIISHEVSYSLQIASSFQPYHILLKAESPLYHTLFKQKMRRINSVS